MVLGVLLAAGLIDAAEAQRGQVESRRDRWVLLGTRSVDLKKDNDRINVGASKGRIRAIRLVGADRLIDIRRVTVVYDGGKTYVEKQRMRLEHGRSSRPIDPGRDERYVERIELDYRVHIGAAGPAKVEIWGLQAPEAVAAAQSGRLPMRETIEPVAKGPATTGAVSPGPVVATEEPAAGSGDVLFGVQQVNFDVDRDVIKLGKQYGKFARLHLKVLGSPIVVNELRVVYGGGEPDIFALNTNIPADGRTPWLTLKGDRFIKEVQFVYAKRSGSRTQTRIEVYGDYAEGWYKPGAGAQAFASENDGWLYLGGQSPLFFSVRKGLGYETDTVSVARNRGFRNLRLDVKDRAITLNQLTIAYADGSSDTLPVKQRVDGGSSYGPIPLKSSPVKEIQVNYRSRIFDSGATARGYSFVEFWAK
jgi:hypothetical protein